MLSSAGRLKGERGHAYELTPAGEALGPLVVLLGTWSREHLKREITAEEADPALLMWGMCGAVSASTGCRRTASSPSSAIATPRTTGAPGWLVAEPSGADLCFTDPGHSIDLQVDAEARAMAEVWVGKTDLGAAMRAKRIKVNGPEHLVRSMPDWLGLSTFAYPDPAAELARRQA